MTAPRRRLVRPPANSTPTRSPRPQALQKARTRLEQVRAALTRWMTRLKRAFNAVDKQQRVIARLERQIRTLEGP
jgi:hypothetical protein